jgi:hypothetical protein
MNVRFDGYGATSRAAKPLELLALLQVDGDTVKQSRGYHNYGEKLSVMDSLGFEVGSVLYGGRNADTPFIEVKGERSPAVAESLRATIEHLPSRLDVCFDVDRPGAWDGMLSVVLAIKEKHRLYGERRGDWDYPEKGRTQYLGADTSPIRSRLYEKGKQPEYRHLGQLDRVRLELQVRPKKEARAVYAELSPLECWGASKWTRELAAELMGEILDPHPPGTIRRDSKRDQSLRWMCRQYAPHLMSLKEELGDWKCVGLQLADIIRDEQRRARRERP